MFVRTQNSIKEYARIVHHYFLEGTFNKEDVLEWMGEINCELTEVTDKKIVFGFFDDWYPTRMTVYKSGRIRVETDLDEFP